MLQTLIAGWCPSNCRSLQGKAGVGEPFAGHILLPQPYTHADSVAIDIEHFRELNALFAVVILVDTRGIDPKPEVFPGRPEPLDGIKEVWPNRHRSRWRVCWRIGRA